MQPFVHNFWHEQRWLFLIQVIQEAVSFQIKSLMLKQANTAAKTKINLQKSKGFFPNTPAAAGEDVFTNPVLESIRVLG